MEGSPPDLNRLLRPRSLAVIGGNEAAEVIRQSRRMGYGGVLYAVNPLRAEIEGLACYRSVEELPEAPDAAFVAVNRHRTVEVVAALKARGAGGAVCYASGFMESGGAGEGLNRDLLAAAGDMPILGPNCYGLVNYMEGAALWPDQHGGKPVERGVAILSQSGNMGINFTMNRRGLPLAFVAALGNQAQIGLSAMTAALAADPRISAIGLHIEGIGNPERFAKAVAAARERGVPVVALKTGRSEAGSRLAYSHTASLAGGAAAMDAFLTRLGVPQLPTIPAFLECLKLLHLHGPLPGRALSALSCSGGEASLMADSLEERRLNYPPLAEPQRERLGAELGELVALGNPLDYHTFIWDDVPRMTATFRAMMSGGFDLNLLVLDYPREDRCDSSAWRRTRQAFSSAAREESSRAAVVASLPECLPETEIEALAEEGVAGLLGISEALLAAEAAADIADAWRRPAPEIGAPVPLRPGSARALDEWEAKRLLGRHGLPLPDGGLAATPGEAVAIAEGLGYPVVVKATGPDLAHKSEQGAVRLGLANADQVAEAAEALAPLGRGLLVERMVTDGLCEVIAGVQRDQVLGLCLLIGSGGVLVELLADSQLLMMPASREDMAEALESLKLAPLLKGFRGKPPADRAALLDALESLQRFALSEAESLLELDINPIILRPEGKGVVAVDALVRRIV